MTTNEDDGDRSRVEHVIEDLLASHARADALREKGVELDVVLVNTDPDAEGYRVECTGCGRTATLPFDPGHSFALCPRCQRGVQ